MSLRSRIEYLCRTHGLDALQVFGSRVQEVCGHLDDERLPVGGAGSDADIGILPAVSGVMTVDRKVAIAAAIEDLLDVRRVDLVIIPDADPVEAPFDASEAALMRTLAGYRRWVDAHADLVDMAL